MNVDSNSDRTAAVASRRQAVAAAAAAKDSSSESSRSSNAPSRNLRKKSASGDKKLAVLTAADADVNVKAAAVVSARASNRSSLRRRKRSASDLFESQPTTKSTKDKKRKSSQPSSNPDTIVSRPSSARSKRVAAVTANQVTPSPASNPGSPAFSFNSPATKKKPRDFFSSPSKLPKEVVDLYPQAPHFCHATNRHCVCEEVACSARSLTASYMQTYGKEYFQHMKDNEEPIVLPSSTSLPSRGSRSSRSRRTAEKASDGLPRSPHTSSSNSSMGSSILSHQTPNHRRDWVHIDTTNLSVTKPTESTTFLDYQPELTPKMRSILMDWIIELSEHFHFSPRTLHLAITLIDKVLSCGPLSPDEEDSEENVWDVDDGSQSKTNCFLIARDSFQLLGATCTWLACKMEEQKPPDIADIAYVSDNIYAIEQIKRMERRVCKALNFALIHQTPFSYVYEFVRASTECPNLACEPPATLHHMVLYLLELGRLPYAPVTKKPSLLAASAVYLARVTLGIQGGDWTKTLQHYTGYSKADLKETVLAIHSYQLAAEDFSLKSVFIKYKAKKYNRVAFKTVVLQEHLGF